MWQRASQGSGGGGVELNPAFAFTPKRIAKQTTESFAIDSTKDYIFVGNIATSSASYASPLVIFIPAGAVDTSDINIMSYAAQSNAALNNGALSITNGNYGQEPMNVTLIALD